MMISCPRAIYVLKRLDIRFVCFHPDTVTQLIKRAGNTFIEVIGIIFNVDALGACPDSLTRF